MRGNEGGRVAAACRACKGAATSERNRGARRGRRGGSAWRWPGAVRRSNNGSQPIIRRGGRQRAMEGDAVALNSNKHLKYQNDKYLAWAYIVRKIDHSINDKTVIMNGYDNRYATHNVLFPWNACRKRATGV